MSRRLTDWGGTWCTGLRERLRNCAKDRAQGQSSQCSEGRGPGHERPHDHSDARRWRISSRLGELEKIVEPYLPPKSAFTGRWPSVHPVRVSNARVFSNLQPRTNERHKRQKPEYQGFARFIRVKSRRKRN